MQPFFYAEKNLKKCYFFMQKMVEDVIFMQKMLKDVIFYKKTCYSFTPFALPCCLPSRGVGRPLSFGCTSSN